MYKSPHHPAPIQELQYRQFSRDGFLALPDFVPGPLLQKLDGLLEILMEVSEDGTDRVLHKNQHGTFVTNLENLCNKGNLACLELLGYPPLLQLAEALCGPDFFLIQEFGVNKLRGDELPVFWHQDMKHEGTGPCFTMGIYLDDAHPGDGALRVIPGSHRDTRDFCTVCADPWVECPMPRGGILLHDMLLAHASLPIRLHERRRVIYFEFLSAAHVFREGIYTEALVQRRSRLHFAASRVHAERHPEMPRFAHAVPPPVPTDEETPVTQILEEIYAEAIHARPSHYCFERSLDEAGR